MADQLDALLAREPFAILDGGLASELEARGLDLDDPLWSAKVLVEGPDRIVEVHRAWLEAGADIVTTASYQATIPGLCRAGHSEAEARAILRGSVALARRAAVGGSVEPVGGADPGPLVAASIGSYGAFLADGSEFRGDYSLTVAALAEFHRARLIELTAAGPDLLAFETIPSATEADAIAELLTSVPGPRAWVSFSLRPDAAGPPRISDGTALAEAVAPLLGHPRIAALGVNCVAPPLVLPAIEVLGRVAPNTPTIAYPNAGERWVHGRWSGSAIDGEGLGVLARRWLDAGARILGGCCRTRPEHVAALARVRAGWPVSGRSR